VHSSALLYKRVRARSEYASRGDIAVLIELRREENGHNILLNSRDYSTGIEAPQGLQSAQRTHGTTRHIRR
jgi:hypothetical protein